MCGIVGFISEQTASPSPQEGKALLKKMVRTLVHRGPDNEGSWIDNHHPVYLGHRRLAILDQTDQGHQPMTSPNGRYAVSYNGEIYNFKILKKELASAGFRFKSQCDTEVLLAAIEAWGLIPALERFVGMFAIALWDKQEETLHLIRDRLGIKPLYYGLQKGTFAFASELKPLKQLFEGQLSISTAALNSFMQLGYVPAPYAIYNNIYKLLPAECLTYSLRSQKTSKTTYWKLPDNSSHYQTLSMNEAEEQLDRLLKTVIRDRLISDVPLGAFLSGGIDSSTVAAIMQTQNSQAIKTFSIGFSEAEYDEAPYAKKIAAHLGTDHTEVYLTPEACLEIIPQLPDIYDEPFADSSQIPTFLLSKVAKESVTVALSGDGGDELFAGYHRHIWAESLSRFQKFLPEEIRFSLGKLLLNPHFLQMLSWLNTRLLPGRLQLDQPELKFRKVGLLLSNKTWNKFYWQCLSSGTMADQLLLEPREIKTPFSHINNMDELLRADLSYYLPNDILTKVDRASMATSLEARVPLLDHRLVEFANQLDLKMKLQQGQSKFLLRQVLSHYVPKRLTNRPKMGFSLPLDHWLRTGLNSWANDLLSPQALEKSGFFNIPTIEKLWRSHCNHQKNHAHVLWNILMFQAWQNT